jgi:hypothetical protein
MPNVVEHLNIFSLGRINLQLTALAAFDSDQSFNSSVLHRMIGQAQSMEWSNVLTSERVPKKEIAGLIRPICLGYQ